MPAYFSGGLYRRGKGLAGLREEAGQAVERGFRGLKMKIGRNPEVPASPLEFQAGCEELTNDLDRDLERVAAVREVLGRSRELMLDVNCNWTPAFAIRAGRALERFRPCWLEEPVAADDHEGSAEVARALDMLEWDQNPNPLRSDLAREPLVLEGDGTVRLPERPGLGIELEPAVVDRHRVEL